MIITDILLLCSIASEQLSRIFLGILSYGPPTGMSLESFSADFEWVTGYALPHVAMGYENAVEMLRAAPFSDVVRITRASRHYYIRKVREYPTQAPEVMWPIRVNGLVEDQDVLDFLDEQENEPFEW